MTHRRRIIIHCIRQHIQQQEHAACIYSSASVVVQSLLASCSVFASSSSCMASVGWLFSLRLHFTIIITVIICSMWKSRRHDILLLWYINVTCIRTQVTRASRQKQRPGADLDPRPMAAPRPGRSPSHYGRTNQNACFPSSNENLDLINCVHL